MTEQAGCGVFLKEGRDIDRVKRSGRRVQTPLFNLMFCPSSLGKSRVAIIVGRRFGIAVRRNRVKRIFRELTRTLTADLIPGHDILVFPKSRALLVKHDGLVHAWRSTLGRAGLLKGHGT